MSDSDETFLYTLGAMLVGLVAFLGSWAYAVATYGWFLGLAFGWIPSLIIAFLIGAVWPLLALAALAFWFLSR